MLGRRQVRAVLGALWLLDAALQCQPSFFHPTAWRLGVAQSVMGEPSWVSRWTTVAVGLFAAHPTVLNGAAVAVQCGLGVALLLDRAPRIAVAVSVPYALGVWWVGEGLGVLPTGFAQPFAGAPGPALLYPVLGLLAWPPRRPRAGRDEPLGPGAVAAWFLLWAAQALLEVPWRYPPAQLLRANLEESGLGSPPWLLPVVHRVSAAVTAEPALTLVGLGVVELVVGLGVLHRSSRRTALGLGLAVTVAFWVVGQSFGGMLVAGGTDPGTAPLVALLTLGLWSARPRGTRGARWTRPGPPVIRNGGRSVERPMTGSTAPSTCTAPVPSSGLASASGPAASRDAVSSATAVRSGTHRPRQPRRPRRHGLVALLVASAVTLAACGGAVGTGAGAPAHGGAPATTAHVVIENFAFHPATFTVAPGATVTVTNRDGVTHTFTARDGAFSSGDIAPGKTVTVTAPTKPGTYPYLCLIHQFMTGTLVVAPG